MPRFQIFVGVLLFKIGYKHRTKCCSGFLREEGCNVPCAENRHVLDELHSGMSYSTVGHEFNVN